MLTKEELLSQVTTEDVIKLLQGYNADYKNGRNGEIIFKSVCHDSDSYKLYYYPNSSIGDSIVFFNESWKSISVGGFPIERMLYAGDILAASVK